jgi:hypothetical protein
VSWLDPRIAKRLWPFRRKTKVDDRASIITDIANRLGVNPAWLDGVIAFESRYDPQAVNPIAYNQARVDKGLDIPRHARGLIQFTDESAQALGYQSSADLVNGLPDFSSQMEFAVLRYFQAAGGPWISEQDFYMTVFYPAYRRAAADKPFPAYVTRVNPGINTPRDYVNKVNTAVASIRVLPVAGTAAVLLALAAVAYFFMG